MVQYCYNKKILRLVDNLCQVRMNLTYDMTKTHIAGVIQPKVAKGGEV